MSQVWRGTDLVLNRRVAIKMLDRRKLTDPTFVERFRREAQAAARLRSPHIVAIYDSITESKYSALILEYVPGLNLRQRLDDGLLDIPTAIGIAMQVAEALQTAHDAGIIHRDIKPGNILLEDTGPVDVLGPVMPQVRVTDFGISKAIEQAGLDLTQTEDMLGTAKYLAPEQVTSSEIDARSDVFSLGVVLYEMVTGSIPWDAGSDLETAMARLDTAPIPPRCLRADISPGLEAVILQAIASDPAKRFASAEDFRTALLTNVEPVVVPSISLPRVDRSSTATPRPRIRSVGRVLLAVVAGLALAGLISLLTYERAPREDITGAAVTVESPVSTTVVASARTTVLARLTASTYDVYGDREENDELIQYAVDDQADRTKFWRTECYQSEFSEIPKPGVGLIIDTGKPVDLVGLTLLTPQTGWIADIYTSSRPSRDLTTITLEGWGPPLTSLASSTSSTQSIFEATPAQSILIFFTSLTNVEPDNCFGGRPNSRHIDLIEATVFAQS